MPKILSEDYNNKLKYDNRHKEKIQKKDFITVKNDYICPFGHLMRLIEVKKVKHRKPYKKMVFQIFVRQKNIFLKPNLANNVQMSKTANIKISNPYFRPYLQNDGKILG